MASADLFGVVRWAMLPELGGAVDLSRVADVYYNGVPLVPVDALSQHAAPSFDPTTLELQPGFNVSTCISLNLADLLDVAKWLGLVKPPKLTIGPY
jgi:hypothetical protein